MRNLSKLALPVVALFMISACSGQNSTPSLENNDSVEASANKEIVQKKENKVNNGSSSAFSADEQKRRLNTAEKDIKSTLAKNGIKFTTPAYNDILKVARQAMDDAATANLQTVAYRYQKFYNPAYLKIKDMNEAKKVKPILAVFDVLQNDQATRLISSDDDAAGVIFSLFKVITTYKSDTYNDPSTMLAYVDNTEQYCKEHENRFYVKRAVAVEMVNKSYKAISKEQKDFIYDYLGQVATINTWKESSDKLTEMFKKLKEQLAQQGK
ncbi:MAG: hypothetical protein U0457_17560 [Candidatus Sericytochromatia bacterium]